ncbi:MAG: DJ-1 family protein [Candidatus Margulisiibacteriota bacterium]|nr:MAG: hypothetical protein A2X43_03765 [Candidatus Margulisbacteria bacterium GWD2_39_127]OGI02469.1 MAG: hypothetical protein A2X42_07280 [Candidatus Margulisbacteria bacterium GWF2_38_17]OGI10962.1 MAG: hypothetical protein A2X41_01805 [Candidatus Margulisbacteria bacterium GWE2_39_32]PZM83157.1 MAG: DJ-1 family protein [Candidatus Margulisiibacteriota bacterium]HAR62542.1 DJ-1 family protein [Candidatus Margulisiibacteriota bacterium]
MKLGMVIAHNGFRDEEYFIPLDFLSSKNIEIITISSAESPAIGKSGGKADVDLLLADVKVEELDALLFIGGPGAREYVNDSCAHTLAGEIVAQKKILGAICMAPLILAHAGVLAGINATVFINYAQNLIDKGANYTGRAVETDGLIITANNVEASLDFAKTVFEKLGAS